MDRVGSCMGGDRRWADADADRDERGGARDCLADHGNVCLSDGGYMRVLISSLLSALLISLSICWFCLLLVNTTEISTLHPSTTTKQSNNSYHPIAYSKHNQYCLILSQNDLPRRRRKQQPALQECSSLRHHDRFRGFLDRSENAAAKQQIWTV